MLRGHVPSVNCVAFAPTGKTFASAGREGTIRFWDARNGQENVIPRGSVSPIDGVVFSADGNRVATTNSIEHTLLIWDAVTGAVISRIALHCGRDDDGTDDCADEHGRRLSFSPDGNTLACDSSVYDIATGRGGNRERRQPGRRFARRKIAGNDAQGSSLRQWRCRCINDRNRDEDRQPHRAGRKGSHERRLRVLNGWTPAGSGQLLSFVQGPRSTTRFRPAVRNPVRKTAARVPAEQFGAIYVAVYPRRRMAPHGVPVECRIDSGLASGRWAAIERGVQL